MIKGKKENFILAILTHVASNVKYNNIIFIDILSEIKIYSTTACITKWKYCNLQ